MTTKFSSKGFTLIELLVVMAILGILMGLVVPKIGRMMDEAKENKCRNNLRQLQVAVMSYVTENDGQLPAAMSYEVTDRGVDGYGYYERKGWIRWNSPSGNLADLKTRWKGANESKEAGMIEDFGIGKEALFGIENGTLYQYMNNSLEHYACPFIKNSNTNKNVVVYRTYAMSGFFRNPENPSGKYRYISRIGTSEDYAPYPNDSNPAKRAIFYRPESAKLLLFSEIQPTVGTYTHSKHNDEVAPRKKSDCCFALNEDNKTFSATVDQIYTVHRSGKPGVQAAFAVFLDGHIEKVFSSVTVGSEKRNTVWYYNRGLDPTEVN